MTLEYRCSSCGTLLQTTNADPLHDEIERLRSQLEHYEWGRKNTQTEMDEREAEIEKLRSQLVIAKAALTDLEEGTECGWARGRARKALRDLTDDQQKPAPKGPAGDAGQVGWMGGEFDR